MRTLRVLLAAGLTASTLVVFAAGAGAKASSASESGASESGAVCDKISVTEADLGGLGGKKFVASEFTTAAKAFKAGAKAAPAQIKRAMTTMANYYKKIGNADSANDAITSLSPGATEKFSKASVTWGTYIATNCS